MQRNQLAPGIYMTVLDAEKFNRCRITVHLRYPARRQSATDAAVLALVLERGYAGCPDMTALSRRLAGLYGAEMGVDLSSAGSDRILSSDLCGIKPQFALNGEDLAAAYTEIVLGILFDPYLVDGLFDAQAVAIEKETLRRRFAAEFNDKRLYCVQQARRRFYGDSPMGIELNGYLPDLDGVTPHSVKAEYDRILSASVIDVIVQGVDAALVADRVQAALTGCRRSPAPLSAPGAVPAVPVQHFAEKVPGLTQAKLCMFFTRGTTEHLPSIHLLRIAMGLFGGSSTSRLFRNVREKQGLCYYCGASAARATGTMLVDSGVEPGNESAAEQAILRELEDLCARPALDEELEETRRGLLSSIDAVGDSLGGLESWYYGSILRQEPFITPEEGKALTSAVTAAQVQELLQSYHCNICYAVTAEKENAPCQ